MPASRSALGAGVTASRSRLAVPSSGAASGLSGTGRATRSGLEVTETDAGTLVTVPGDVLFDFDRSDIRADAEPVLEQLAAMISDTDEIARVDITGHTDSKGSDTYNQTLSERRAEAARGYLVDELGLDDGLFATDGRGESDPVAPNSHPDGSDNPAGRQRNRRIEILLVR
ncbi:OmpA family protein [Kaustia mangrovi]|uniref:OmpA family protein n=1 Tax=Kaustia mangrovi TaxID=2593653 RepID=A0A7S8C294_9HYPH|nr:OmpA family protein [Kaustia mangrovi]QPC42048.1 OmpA family protein [Kaustia mangrovi]